MGTRPESPVGLHRPAAGVVARREAGSRPARELVVPVSPVGSDRAGEAVHLSRLAVPRQGKGAEVFFPGEGCSLLDGQWVEREVFGLEIQGLLQLASPAPEGLPGQPVDEVEGDVSDTGLPEDPESFEGFRAGMNPPDAAQETVFKGLDAQGNPVHPEGRQAVRPCPAHCPGICLHGDFRGGMAGMAGPEEGEDVRWSSRS